MNDPQKPSRIPKGSIFFERIIPVLFIAMGVLMGFLVLFAVGVLIGIIQF